MIQDAIFKKLVMEAFSEEVIFKAGTKWSKGATSQENTWKMTVPGNAKSLKGMPFITLRNITKAIEGGS